MEMCGPLMSNNTQVMATSKFESTATPFPMRIRSISISEIMLLMRVICFCRDTSIRAALWTPSLEELDIETLCISRVIYSTLTTAQCSGVASQGRCSDFIIRLPVRRQRKLMRKIGTHRIICNSAICVEGKFELPPPISDTSAITWKLRAYKLCQAWDFYKLQVVPNHQTFRQAQVPVWSSSSPGNYILKLTKEILDVNGHGIPLPLYCLCLCIRDWISIYN